MQIKNLNFSLRNMTPDVPQVLMLAVHNCFTHALWKQILSRSAFIEEGNHCFNLRI